MCNVYRAWALSPKFWIGYLKWKDFSHSFCALCLQAATFWILENTTPNGWLGNLFIIKNMKHKGRKMRDIPFGAITSRWVANFLSPSEWIAERFSVMSISFICQCLKNICRSDRRLNQYMSLCSPRGREYGLCFNNVRTFLFRVGTVWSEIRPTVSEALRICRMNTSFLDGQGLVKPHWLR